MTGFWLRADSQVGKGDQEYEVHYRTACGIDHLLHHGIYCCRQCKLTSMVQDQFSIDTARLRSFQPRVATACAMMLPIHYAKQTSSMGRVFKVGIFLPHQLDLLISR